MAEHLGLPAKGEEIHQADGMRLADLKANPDFYCKYIKYALNDGTICEGIYDELVRTGRFPPEEIRVQDLVLRCAVQPVLHADVPMLKKHVADLREHKRELLDACGRDRKTLMSAAKFKGALEDAGVVVKTKISAKGRTIAALAKIDDFMHELVEYHDADEETNLHIQTLTKARLAHRSVQEETRAQKFINIASLPWLNGQPMLPIPLVYAGAKTHRLAGDWGMNLQNLARDTNKSKLRSSITAPKGLPEGFKIISADSSQIEARIAACISGQTDLVAAFRRGIDVYAEFASTVFGRPITKKDNPVERFIGKTGILSLQYGSGWLRFHLMVMTQARAAGIDLRGVFDEQVAQRTVRMYRKLYSRIPASWRYLDRAKQSILLNDQPSQEAKLGPVTIMSRRIRLPNGLCLRYDDPVDKRLWGGTLLNHICQSLAYVILMQAARRLHRKGLRFSMQVHDELIFLVADTRVEEAKAIIHAEMIRPPVWCEGLPLAVEVGAGDNYGGVK